MISDTSNQLDQYFHCISRTCYWKKLLVNHSSTLHTTSIKPYTVVCSNSEISQMLLANCSLVSPEQVTYKKYRHLKNHCAKHKTCLYLFWCIVNAGSKYGHDILQFWHFFFPNILLYIHPDVCSQWEMSDPNEDTFITSLWASTPQVHAFSLIGIITTTIKTYFMKFMKSLWDVNIINHRLYRNSLNAARACMKAGASPVSI